MHLLDHVSISVPNLQAARPFYDAVMAALGVAKVYDLPDALGYGERCDGMEGFHSCLPAESGRACVIHFLSSKFPQ